MKHFCLFCLSAALLMAMDPSWTSKPVSQWNPDDARQVLGDSPWSKAVRPALLPQLNESQLREGGQMGGARRMAKWPGVAGAKRGKDAPKLGAVLVRWESALTVRTAHLKAGDANAPEWDGDYYVIAVSDVPGADYNGLAGELKSLAFLKRNGKKDLRPSRVDVVSLGSTVLRVVYLFSRSQEITPEDQHIEFVAQIGPLYVSEVFNTQDMQLQGKLEL